MKAGRVLGYVVGGIIALVVLVLLSVWLLVDPNKYKPKIEAAVKHATGRQLLLQGDIKLTVFPWIALELGPASLGNPPGFGDQPFVSFKHAAFRVRLLPLLAKRLQIGKVDIDGLDARLVKHADGRGNWEGFGQARPAQARPAEAAVPGQAEPAPTAAAEDAGQEFEGIAGITLTNSRVSYDQYALENLNLQTGSFAEKALVPVALHFDANRGVAGEHAAVDAQFDFSADLAAKRYHIAAVTLNGTVGLAGNARPVRWNFSTPALDANLESQTLSAPAFALDVAGAQVNGSLEGSKLIDALALSGKMALEPLVVREFLPRFGLAAPTTRDPKALSLVSASFDFGYGGNAAKLDDLKVVLDTTHLTGSAAIVDLDTQALKFALAVDAIDLDRYLAPANAPSAAPASTATNAGSKPAAAAPKSKPLEANGTLTVGAVHLAPLDLTAVSVTVAASGGVIHLYPLQAQVDGGQYSGNITLDSRDSVPLLSLDEHLAGIEVGKLVSTGSKSIHISGRGNVSLKATGRGAAADALMKTLNGHLDTFVANGAVEGVDIGYQLGRAESLIRRQDTPNAQDTERTKFDALKMSADIVNGVAQTKDLTLSSPVFKVTGQGTANLPTTAIDFSLLADTLRMAGNTPIQIPIKVTGTTADPTVRPDLEALAKGQLRQKVQDVLQDKLKGLFNR